MRHTANGAMYYLIISIIFSLLDSFFKFLLLWRRSVAFSLNCVRFLSLLRSISKDSFIILLTSISSWFSFSMFCFALTSLNSFSFLLICFSIWDETLTLTYQIWWRHTGCQLSLFYLGGRHQRQIRMYFKVLLRSCRRSHQGTWMQASVGI
jgi:hypothetical protein